MSKNYYRIDTINLNPTISCLYKQIKNQIYQNEKEKTITLFYSPLIFSSLVNWHLQIKQIVLNFHMYKWKVKKKILTIKENKVVGEIISKNKNKKVVGLILCNARINIIIN